MRGYPKFVATKQDFLNLLEMEEFKTRALEDIQALLKAPDEKVQRVVSGSEEEGNLVAEEIDNPMPLWKIKGFESKEKVAEIVKKYSPLK